MEAEARKGKKQKDFCTQPFFPNPRPWPDVQNPSGWYGRLRWSISPLPVSNTVQLGNLSVFGLIKFASYK